MHQVLAHPPTFPPSTNVREKRLSIIAGSEFVKKMIVQLKE